MKASSYIIFNGNCKEAVKLYEKAFKSKASLCFYKEAPASPEMGEIPKELGDYVMHGVLPIGKSTIYLCDTPPTHPTKFGNGSYACVEFGNAGDVKSAFEILKEGGKVICEPTESFFNKCYVEVEDKFGQKWSLMVECTCLDGCAGGNNPNCTCKGCMCKDKKI